MMETEVINTLANSTNVVILILLASGPLFGASILFIAYRFLSKYWEKFVNAMENIAKQTEMMGELIENMREEIEDVKAITSDNNRRLEIIEKTGITVHGR